MELREKIRSVPVFKSYTAFLVRLYDLAVRGRQKGKCKQTKKGEREEREKQKV